MKRKLLNLLLALILLPLTSCSNTVVTNKTTKLSFKSASKYEYLKTLDGTKVEIDGYMATMSPVDKSFIFLMNLPFQSCPFCKPNTTELSNTIEIYPATGVDFSYNPSPIRVVGTLKVAPEGQPFTDIFDYQFSFKIVDASYTIIQDEEMQYSVQLYKDLSDSGLISDMYNMYEFVSFMCTWPEYYVDTYTNKNGDVVKGYYLYASDAIYFLEEGHQYGYGRKENYFSDLKDKFVRVCKDNFPQILTNIDKCKELCDYAYDELIQGHYTVEFKYVEKFDNQDYIYTLNDKTLKTQYENLYQEFSDCLGEL